MAEKNWNAGDVVRLKSNGPKMVVNRFMADGTVECVWFDSKNEYQTGAFNPAGLEAA